MALAIRRGTVSLELSTGRVEFREGGVNSTSVLSGLGCELTLTAYPLNEIGCKQLGNLTNLGLLRQMGIESSRFHA